MKRNGGAVPLHAALDQIGHGAERHAEYDHRVESDHAAQHEAGGGHAFAPAVVVGITENEAGEHEEEVDGKITMVQHLVDGRSGESFAEMVEDHENGRDSAQAVEQVISRPALEVMIVHRAEK